MNVSQFIGRQILKKKRRKSSPPLERKGVEPSIFPKLVNSNHNIWVTTQVEFLLKYGQVFVLSPAI